MASLAMDEVTRVLIVSIRLHFVHLIIQEILTTHLLNISRAVRAHLALFLHYRCGKTEFQYE